MAFNRAFGNSNNLQRNNNSQPPLDQAAESGLLNPQLLRAPGQQQQLPRPALQQQLQQHLGNNNSLHFSSTAPPNTATILSHQPRLSSQIIASSAMAARIRAAQLTQHAEQMERLLMREASCHNQTHTSLVPQNFLGQAPSLTATSAAPWVSAAGPIVTAPTKVPLASLPIPLPPTATTTVAPTNGLDLLRTVTLGLFDAKNSAARSSGSITVEQSQLTSESQIMEEVQLKPPPAIKDPSLQANDTRSVGSDSSDNKKQPAKKLPRLYVEDVREWDVLCGRGGRSNHHAGNKRYRNVVREMKAMYKTVEEKTAKTDTSRAIVEHVCNYGGRFLKKDEIAGRWYVLTKAEARRKTAQALRESKEPKWTV